MRVNRVRAEMAELGLDETALSMLGKMSLGLVQAVLGSLGIGDTLAWRLVQRGELRTVKLGRRRLVPRSALDDVLRGQLVS